MGTLVQTNPGTVMGTLEYMSPEQARGAGDGRALGCLEFGLRDLRDGYRAEERSRARPAPTRWPAILADEPPPLTDIIPTTPPELQRIVTRTLQKKRSERYQTVKELLADLRALKQEREFRARLSSTHLIISHRVQNFKKSGASPLPEPETL